MSKDLQALKMLLQVRSKISFFEGLTEDEISGLLTDVVIRKYKNHQVIFNEGETKDDSMYYLLKGKISVSKISQVSKIKTRLSTIVEPCLFGEMMHLTGEPRSATVESCEEDTIVIAFKTKNIEEQEITHISQFYKNVILELSNKINQMNKKAT